MLAPHNPNPPLKRDMHPLQIMLLIVSVVLAFPLLIYLLFIFAFLLMPGGFD